jgi:uncharacterized membrane protein YoaK (UPF0700 family)
MYREGACPRSSRGLAASAHSRLRAFRTAGAHVRNDRTDLLLGMFLAFVAGAINAGGFLAIGQYTSHMTGIISAIADHLVLGSFAIVGAGLAALLAFMAGAACSAVLINWGRRNARSKQFAYPLVLEAALLLAFGTLGATSHEAPEFMALGAPVLCFIMGLQNATITKVSGARMRTTHLTGMVTDIGIELGKMAYWNRDRSRPDALKVRGDRQQLDILLKVVGMFFLGGISGALGFTILGYLFVVPLTAVLLALSRPQLMRSRPARIDQEPYRRRG